jgi:osmotically-inducible protein OsmY
VNRIYLMLVMTFGCAKADVQHLGKIGELTVDHLNKNLHLDELPIPRTASSGTDPVESVRTRIQLDSSLEEAMIEVEKTERGVRLKGTAKSEEQKAHAEGVAKLTKGITEVENQIEVQEIKK